jgi:hypothetical protein
MILVTYATHNSGYLNALKESSKLNGYELIILGENKKWEGFTQKFFDILLFLKTKSMNEIICFVDGFDVLTLGTKDEFINKFNSFNTDKVIFSASKDNFILQLIFGKINSNDSNFEYNRLCTGAYVGYCNKIIELFENICEIHKLKVDDDDQKNISVCYVNCKNCLQLDYNNSLFYCVESSNGIFEYINLFFKKQPYMELNNNFYFIENNRLVLKKNNVKPIFIQGNGNLNMDILTERLNLPPKNTDNRNYFDYSTKGFLYKILTICCGYLVMILHILFSIFVIFAPFITNNIHILLLVIIVKSFILTQWFFFGSCFLNKIENDLLSRTDTVYEDGKEKSFFVHYFAKYFDESNTYTFFSLLPLIVSTFCILKIMYILHKKKIYFKLKL